MKRFVSFLAGVAIIQLIQAQVVEEGSCNPNITTINPFESSKYLGRWYENQKYPFIFEFEGKCIYAEYGQMENGEISVYNFNINQRSGQPSDIKGSARIVDNGKLKVKFTSVAFAAFAGESNYWILDTDYDNYSVVYSCRSMGNLINAKVVWILTRQRHPEPDIVERAKKVIERNGLSLTPLIITDQSGCETKAKV